MGLLLEAAGTIIVEMARSAPFTLVYAPAVKQHMKRIDRRFYSLIRDKIEEQLLFEPGVETTNRKPLQQPIEAGGEWELRFGSDNRFRVFYDIEPQARQVNILAIGVKQHNRLVVGEKEIIP